MGIRHALSATAVGAIAIAGCTADDPEPAAQVENPDRARQLLDQAIADLPDAGTFVLRQHNPPSLMVPSGEAAEGSFDGDDFALLYRSVASPESGLYDAELVHVDGDTFTTLPVPPDVVAATPLGGWTRHDAAAALWPMQEAPLESLRLIEDVEITDEADDGSVTLTGSIPVTAELGLESTLDGDIDARLRRISASVAESPAGAKVELGPDGAIDVIEIAWRRPESLADCAVVPRARGAVVSKIRSAADSVEVTRPAPDQVDEPDRARLISSPFFAPSPVDLHVRRSDTVHGELEAMLGAGSRERLATLGFDMSIDDINQRFESLQEEYSSQTSNMPHGVTPSPAGIAVLIGDLIQIAFELTTEYPGSTPNLDQFIADAGPWMDEAIEYAGFVSVFPEDPPEPPPEIHLPEDFFDGCPE